MEQSNVKAMPYRTAAAFYSLLVKCDGKLKATLLNFAVRIWAELARSISRSPTIQVACSHCWPPGCDIAPQSFCIQNDNGALAIGFVSLVFGACA